MAHVGILFCLYDHLKHLKEENIMAYMSEEGYKKLMAELAGNQGECVNDGYLLWFYVCSLDVGFFFLLLYGGCRSKYYR